MSHTLSDLMKSNNEDEKDEIHLHHNHHDDEKKSPQELWDGYPRIEQPSELSIKLFPHQLVTVYNMEQLERLRKIKYNTNHSFLMTDFGILGDIPGYGKSLSVVSLLLRDKMQWDITKPHQNTEIYTYNQSARLIQREHKKRVKANLLVVSSTLIEQWKDYFAFVKPGNLIIKEVSSKKDVDELTSSSVNECDVIICSSTRYNDLMSQVGGRHIVWKRFIFDEAASTHIPNMRHVSAGFMWFVTATYQQLMMLHGTSAHFMKSFFENISWDILPYFVIRNDIEFVKHSFKMPEVFHNIRVCSNPRLLNVLSNYIDQETKMMISAGDIRGAVARLGGQSAMESNLFEIVSKRQHEKLSQAEFSVSFWKERGIAGQKEVENWEKKVQEIKKNIDELERKYKNILSEDCSICYSELQDPVLLPCCQNIFCGPCIVKWMESNKSCPLCRSNIDIKLLTCIYKNNESVAMKKQSEKNEKDVKEIKTKPKTVLDIVQYGLQEKKKFLIFSMYDESFSIIRRELDDNKIDFVEISGTKAMRDAKLKRFKEGKVNIVFLNSRFNGAGINLEMATDIILYHEMPPAIEEQVIGRALRIGRECNLTIHHLVSQE